MHTKLEMQMLAHTFLEFKNPNENGVLQSDLHQNLIQSERLNFRNENVGSERNDD